MRTRAWGVCGVQMRRCVANVLAESAGGQCTRASSLDVRGKARFHPSESM